jgi:hypothetical protein
LEICDAILEDESLPQQGFDELFSGFEVVQECENRGKFYLDEVAIESHFQQKSAAHLAASTISSQPNPTDKDDIDASARIAEALLKEQCCIREVIHNP